MRRTALWSTRGLLIALVAWAGLSSGVAWAQTAPPGVGSFSGSPDVTVALPTATLADEGVGRDELSSLGLSVPVDLGPLPPSADVTAYHLLSGGDRLFTLDTSTTLPGPVTVRPGDVVRYDGAGYTIELDAAALGIPDGARTDALGEIPPEVFPCGAGLLGRLLISFDITVVLPGPVTAADEDMVCYDGTNFLVLFDGTSFGLAGAWDVDGFNYRFFGGTQYLAYSFDTSGQLGGVDFDDEDVMELDGDTLLWSLAYDGAGPGFPTEPADLDAIALPEPGYVLSLASGLALLALLWHRRRNALG